MPRSAISRSPGRAPRKRAGSPPVVAVCERVCVRFGVVPALGAAFGRSWMLRIESTGALPLVPPTTRIRPGRVTTPASESGWGRRAATRAWPSAVTATTLATVPAAPIPPTTYIVCPITPADACMPGAGRRPICVTLAVAGSNR